MPGAASEPPGHRAESAAAVAALHPCRPGGRRTAPRPPEWRLRTATPAPATPRQPARLAGIVWSPGVQAPFLLDETVQHVGVLQRRHGQPRSPRQHQQHSRLGITVVLAVVAAVVGVRPAFPPRQQTLRPIRAHTSHAVHEQHLHVGHGSSLRPRRVTTCNRWCSPLDLGVREIPYAEGFDLQEVLHRQVVAGESVPTILLLEHAFTYTAGTRTQPADLPLARGTVAERQPGGRITWHGPGQVVAYPIVPLPNPVDVVAYVRRLEAALMATCEEFGLATQRVEGRSGVWVTGGGKPDRKVAAIGVRGPWVTMHGVALNVDCDLTAYDAIVPCGITDAGVTSLAAEDVPLPDSGAVVAVAERLGAHLRDALSWD